MTHCRFIYLFCPLDVTRGSFLTLSPKHCCSWLTSDKGPLPSNSLTRSFELEKHNECRSFPIGHEGSLSGLSMIMSIWLCGFHSQKISTQINNRGRFWSDVLDTIHHHQQYAKWGNMFWKNDVHGVPETWENLWQGVLKISWRRRSVCRLKCLFLLPAGR